MSERDRFRLDGKTALITGAGSGLGRQFAMTLATAGATVVLAARRAEKLEETRSLVAKAGGEALCVSLDVTDGASVQQCFTELDDAGQSIDILVNNAGISRTGFLAELSEADWDAVVDTNLKGVFLVAQATARRMLERGRGGSIINIASILGFRVSKTLGSYVAAKSGVVNLTKTMALEWARFGIRVNAIAPGYFETEINTGFLSSPAGQTMLQQVPLRRSGVLSELDGPLLLLASEAGSYMTGSTITVDGGHLCSSL
ncbi:SDR family NAD(P)-dependent oxidoreductase [Woeseia oceani]|uniref:2-deoxy-D-gluconate 3-dehydrogenase n=1 Tax=Woeseia oceani TaxID=1548547 RepID=A0A193LH54_9GAMM|nr:SDR family oxidoreductase [Woeseia oceani]ANO51788.1 2-deoxy-D-gluconate 3-dehydrogenase [Woeseia oceani]